MSIHRFFDQNVTIRRLKGIAGGNMKAFQSTATVEAHIQGLDNETRRVLGITEERAWKAWFDVDTVLEENDVLTDEAGTQYNVREITKKAYGVNQHLEVILMEQSD